MAGDACSIAGRRFSARVLIMSAAPGRIIEDMPVPLPRPRSPDVSTDPAFVALKRHCLQTIRTESLKAFEDQDH